MPIALLAALAGSFAIHAAALFLPDVDLSTAPELPVITAEIQLPPRPLAAGEIHKPPAPKPRSEHRRTKPAKGPAVAEPEAAEVPAVPREVPGAEQPEAKAEPVQEAEPPAPAEPRLPSQGHIRFAVYKGSEGLLVGQAVHSWEFADGHYRLQAVTETVGLAALFKPIRVELESRGELTAGGLQPERFTTRRNGNATNENADFDWNVRQVTLERDGSRRDLPEGAQDLLSFHYQFGYLATAREGIGMGVATGKKFENYRFEAVGEEDIDTPAGHFRTLHVRVKIDSTTELWLARDRLMVPVKIRYTDKKGESFEQVATELGI
ncbi:MAG: hypothetical protein H6R10_210 [Rhodocyclaceae bacterium]|nr:hypothetical protein [Rhodocyclaceae bacterium]